MKALDLVLTLNTYVFFSISFSREFIRASSASDCNHIRLGIEMLSVILMVLVFTTGKSKTAEIHCEKIANAFPSKNLCFLNENTTISAVNVTIADLENAEVDGIFFSDNKNVAYLPVEVYKKFPNLVYFYAHNASIEEITALNFNRLSSLNYLGLSENKIEFIPNFCFESLFRVEYINLSGNKIKRMSGVAFANLPVLVVLELKNNDCIDKEFTIGSDPNVFRRKISRNCALSDTNRHEISCWSVTKCGEELDEKFFMLNNKTSSCCNLESRTHIDLPDYTFEAGKNYTDLEIISIVFQRNIEFLPISVYKNFPTLRMYFVKNTPVRKISKKNFEKLNQLVALTLMSNEIEVIRSDTFEDLISLQILMISMSCGLRFKRDKNLNSNFFKKK